MGPNTFDLFRACYESMSPRAIAKFYKQIEREHGCQDFVDIVALDSFFSGLSDKYVRRVVEIGGGSGKAKTAILSAHPGLFEWVDYEVTGPDPRFIWDHPPDDVDILVFSHILEHLTERQIAITLLGTLDARYMYVDGPFDAGLAGWDGNGSGHIYTGGWAGLERLLQNAGWDKYGAVNEARFYKRA